MHDDALTDLLDELLHVLAERSLDPATVLDVLPSAGPLQPPDPPVIVDWRKAWRRQMALRKARGGYHSRGRRFAAGLWQYPRWRPLDSYRIKERALVF